MNVLIVEDEAPAARRLHRLVAAELRIKSNEITIIDNLSAANQHIAQHHVDLLLLDLDLSGHDGFDTLRNIKKTQPVTIIVSANVDRALEAFDHQVVDFVSKPVSAPRLSQALNRALEARSEDMRLVIRSLGRVDVVVVSRIVRLSGADDYVEIMTNDGRCLLHSDRLDALERNLPPSFIRTHRSHIVNMEYVTQLLVTGKNQQVVVTSLGEQVPISRRKLGSVKEIFSAGKLRNLKGI